MKNEAPEARKNRKTGTRSRLGGSWSGSWRPGRDFLGISAHVGAKMGARWAKLGPSWQLVSTKMAQDSAKLAILGSTWEVLGAGWGSLACAFMFLSLSFSRHTYLLLSCRVG